MIVVVASIKGAPGVTTTATALASTWPPGRRVLLVEADPFGGDLAAWFGVAPSTGLWSLLAAGRRGLDPHAVWEHATNLPTGLAVLYGLASADQAVANEAAWPAVAEALAALDANVIIDVGRLLPHFAGGIGPLLSLAQVLLVLCPPTLAGIVHLKTALPSLIATSSSRQLSCCQQHERLLVRRDRLNSEDQRRTDHPPRSQGRRRAQGERHRIGELEDHAGQVGAARRRPNSSPRLRQRCSALTPRDHKPPASIAREDTEQFTTLSSSTTLRNHRTLSLFATRCPRLLRLGWPDERRGDEDLRRRCGGRGNFALAAARPVPKVDRLALVEDLARDAMDQVAAQMIQQGLVTPSAEAEAQVLRHVVASQLGLGRLQLLLDDDSIENIDINGCDNVWVKRADGTKEQVDAVTDSDAELVELVQRAARAHHTGGERRIDAAKPIVDLHLAGSHRLSAMIEVSHRPCVSIRRHRLVDPTLADLADSMSAEVWRFLSAAVRARLNIIVSGGTDAGKTTMLRALLAEASPQERIITIELSYELGLHELTHRHPDCAAWETREANTEGEGAITMDQLVQRANRHNADRVIVGEVLGDEIVPMLNAMTAGKAGSMCTIHADSTEGTFGRIQSYASQSPKHLSDAAAAKLTAQALDLVVFVRQQPAAGAPAGS